MLPASILPGSPALPFVLRLNMATATYLRIGLWISLAAVAVFWVRVPTLTITAHLYLASLSAVCASSIWWRHHCQHAPFGGSYCRWREVPAGLLRVADAVLGSSWLWPRAWLDGLVPGSYDGCWLRHVIVMLWASAAPTRLLYWAFTMRIFFALPLHILMAFMLARRNVEVCDSATLATPAAEQHTHTMYQVLNLLRFSLLAPSAQPTLSPRNECAVVLTYLHISLGLALPAVVAARVETRLFSLHQRQLSQLGLPPEKGWQPRLYGSFERLLDALEWPTVVLIAWMSMGILFDVSLLASDGRLVPGELPALHLHQLSL